jgi:hypothetical protein
MRIVPNAFAQFAYKESSLDCSKSEKSQVQVVSVSSSSRKRVITSDDEDEIATPEKSCAGWLLPRNPLTISNEDKIANVQIAQMDRRSLKKTETVKRTHVEVAIFESDEDLIGDTPEHGGKISKKKKLKKQHAISTDKISKRRGEAIFLAIH